MFKLERLLSPLFVCSFRPEGGGGGGRGGGGLFNAFLFSRLSFGEETCLASLVTFLADSGMVVSLLYIGTSRSLTLLLILGARESERPPSGTVRCVGLSGCDSAM